MKQQVLQILQELSIPQCGIAPVPQESELIPCRGAVRLPKQAKSVIVCLFPYWSKQLEKGNISRYAMVEDYHHMLGEILENACRQLASVFDYQFCWFADNSPIPEISAAVQAGLGFAGKQGLLITPQYGTWQFIGEIVTDMPLEPDTPCCESCLNCGSCMLHCPGNAIADDGFCRDCCASHVNQLKRDLSPIETELVYRCGSLWGCDICQQVCPHNNKVQETPLQRFLENIVSTISPETAPGLVKTRAFGFRGVKPLLRNYGIIYSKSVNNTSE